jgi:hypothetical protein
MLHSDKPGLGSYDRAYSHRLHDRVLGLRIKGRVEKADLDAVAMAFERKLQGYPHPRIYAEVQEMGSISPAALIENLGLSLGHFHDVERKNRLCGDAARACAVQDHAYRLYRAQFGVKAPSPGDLRIRAADRRARAHGHGGRGRPLHRLEHQQDGKCAGGLPLFPVQEPVSRRLAAGPEGPFRLPRESGTGIGAEREDLFRIRG